MSLISTNSIEPLQEAKSDIDDESKIDNDVNAMFDDDEDEDFLENVEINENFSNLIETSTQILENDRSVFENLLESNFVTSMNESMLLEGESSEDSNKEKKQKILTQINKIITGAKEASKQSGAKLYSEFGKIIKSDNNLTKYINAINKADFSDFAGISNFCFPNDAIAKAIDEVEDLSDIVKCIYRANQNIIKAGSNQDIDELIDEFELCMDSINDDYMEATKRATAKQENWKPSKKDITLMKCFAKGDTVKKAITSSSNNADKCIDKIKKSCVRATETISNNVGELQVVKMNAVYRCASNACRLILKKIKSFQDLEIREIAAYRRAIITCGKYAININNGIKESAEEQDINNIIIGESSDMYIFERFSK